MTPKQWLPIVRIRTPKPDDHGATHNIFTNIEIDGRQWMVVGYAVNGDDGVDKIQTVTLTFLADVVIEHEDAK